MIQKLDNLMAEGWEWSISHTKEWGYMVRCWKRYMPLDLKWTDSPFKQILKKQQKWMIESEFNPNLEKAINNLLEKL